MGLSEYVEKNMFLGRLARISLKYTICTGDPNSAKFRVGCIGWPKFDKDGGGGGCNII